MRTIKLLSIIALITTSTFSQNVLTLDECYKLGRENFPLIKQKEYIEKSREYTVSNIWKSYFPQITISSQATYQSDVTSIPLSLPGMKIEPVSKDQYKAVADISQVIYDGGLMSAQSKIQNAASEVDDYKIEIELIKVKERINQLYFGILLLDKQLLQTELTKADLKASLEKLNGAYANGTVTSSDVDILKAEILKLAQREIEINSSRKSFLDMLGLMINKSLDQSAKLELPEANNSLKVERINRPEISMYTSQEKMIDQQSGLSLAKILPKASLFVQGAYGKPTLNMLKNNFDWYYIAGARLSWSLSSLYTYGNESEIIELNKKSVESQKESFLLNNKLLLIQYQNEFEKLQALVKIDEDIIAIRTSVKNSAKAKLENGVITSSDYLRELNAEDQAKQNLAMHTIQKLLAEQNYKLTTGN
ncbi:MAG: TolC family protein [Ignavibacteriaceae bacterium]|jgi:outer membrane protein TolC|nr:TolC family protein [Ignavibacteriaceae bacterium]